MDRFERRACVKRPLATVVSMALCGCASQTYMGVQLGGDKFDPALQELALRARSGDKQAQLDLGIAFERGLGLPRDAAKARTLYRRAASDSGGSIWVYVPSVGNGTRGTVAQVDRGPKISGLAEAKARLRLLAEISKEN